MWRLNAPEMGHERVPGTGWRKPGFHMAGVGKRLTLVESVDAKVELGNNMA